MQDEIVTCPDLGNVSFERATHFPMVLLVSHCSNLCPNGPTRASDSFPNGPTSFPLLQLVSQWSNSSERLVSQWSNSSARLVSQCSYSFHNGPTRVHDSFPNGPTRACDSFSNVPIRSQVVTRACDHNWQNHSRSLHQKRKSQTQNCKTIRRETANDFTFSEKQQHP